MQPAATPQPRRRVDHSPAAEFTFTQLYEAHYETVLAYCMRRASRADAQDAVAEVFTIAWRKIPDVPNDDRALIWLYGVAYRVLSHHWRSRRRRTRLVERLARLGSEAEPSPETVIVRRAQDRQVIDAAQRLSEADREILQLAGWEELAHAEIAELLGISTSAVDQRFHRAKKRLAREYDRVRTDRPPTSAQEGGSE